MYSHEFPQLVVTHYCATCRKSILPFCGIRRAWGAFCCAGCDRRGWTAMFDAFGRESIEAEAAAACSGHCPHCGDAGPLDVRSGTRVTSYFVAAETRKSQHFGCRECTRKRLRADVRHTLLFGFWSAHGLALASFALVRTWRELARPWSDTASDALREAIVERRHEAQRQAAWADHQAYLASFDQRHATMLGAGLGGGWS